jgi:hypothetical protein
MSAYTTWQGSRKNKGLGRALRAPNPYFFVMNLRTLPGRVCILKDMHLDGNGG